MPKRFGPLDRINVASPCSADWEEMLGNEQVRICRQCSLQVHDLSKITRKDVVKLVSTSKGKLCVRYYRRLDGTIHTAAQAAPLAQIKRRLSRLAAGAFTATLSLAANAPAQSNQTAERSPVVSFSPAVAGEKEQSDNSYGATTSLAGTIFDPAGAVVPGARVILTNGRTGQEQSIDTGEEGTFRFQNVEAGAYSMKVEAPGFNTYQKENLVLQSGVEQRSDATLDVGVIMTGGVMVMEPSTPLVSAIWNDDMPKVGELLAAGVDVNVVDESTNSTALGEAVAVGRLELVRTLLNAGADPNMRNGSGMTALMRVDDDATAEVVRALVDAGARVNLKDEDGDSALLVAAGVEKPDVLQALLDAGAKINTRNKEGKTALMIAAEDGYVENVKALLLAGADVNRKDKEGATALKYARDNDKMDVIALLIAYGAID